MFEGEPTARVGDLAEAVGAQQVSWDGDKKEVYVLLFYLKAQLRLNRLLYLRWESIGLT
jgi:hypothetical protein